MTSYDVIKALRLRYPLPEWAAFEELRDGTGSSMARSIDFWAMNCYPSKGFLSVAVEVKVSRGDFVRELENPRKRESAELISRETYFAAPAGLIKAGEVPEGWGLIEVIGNGTARVNVRAKQRDKPAYDSRFIASIVRRGAEDEARLRNMKVKIDEANVAAADVEGYLAGIAVAHIKQHRDSWIRTMKDDAVKEVLGEGYGELLRALSTEFGYIRGEKSPSEFMLELV